MSKYLEGMRATIVRMREQASSDLTRTQALEKEGGSNERISRFRSLAERNERIAAVFESALVSWKERYPGKDSPAVFFLSRLSYLPVIPRELVEKVDLALAERSILPMVSILDTRRWLCHRCRETTSLFEEWSYRAAHPEEPLKLHKRFIAPCPICIEIFEVRE
jgi:hypothetical protein